MPLLTDREVDEELASDWKDILSKHAVEDEETPPAKGEKGAEAEGAGAGEGEGGADDAQSAAKGAPADKGAADQPRDKTGRYKPLPKAAKGAAAKGGEETPAAAGDAAQAQPGTRQQPTEGQQPDQVQQRDVTRPPSTWSPKERAAWDKVPPDARAAIHRREADFLAGQSQLLPDARFGAEMARTIEPYRMLIESEGGTPAAAVLDLLKTAAILRTGTVQQKYGTMANIAQRFGIDLRLFAPRPQQGNGQPLQVPPQQDFRDPRVDGLLQHLQTQEQQRAAQDQRDTENVVSRWMNEADAKGNPKRPYVGDVIDAMSVMIPQIKAGNPTLTHTQALEAAYEAAIWANPEIRALLQSQQQTATETQRRAESQRRTNEARRAASVNVTRRAALPSRPQTGSMEETIAETARELGLISS